MSSAGVSLEVHLIILKAATVATSLSLESEQ